MGWDWVVFAVLWCIVLLCCVMMCGVEHIRCNSHVYIIDVMMTQSRKVRSGTHIAVNGLSIMENVHLMCCAMLCCVAGGDGDFFHISEAKKTTLQDIVVYGLLTPKERCV